MFFVSIVLVLAVCLPALCVFCAAHTLEHSMPVLMRAINACICGRGGQ